MGAHDVIHLFTIFTFAHAQRKRQQKRRFYAGALFLLVFFSSLNRTKLYKIYEIFGTISFRFVCDVPDFHVINWSWVNANEKQHSKGIDNFSHQLKQFLIVCQFEILLPPNLPIIIISVAKTRFDRASQRTFFLCRCESITYLNGRILD